MPAPVERRPDIYGPPELVELAAEISAPLEGAETHKERIALLSQLASGLGDLVRARARVQVETGLEPEQDTLQVMHEIYDGTYRTPQRRAVSFDLWNLENLHLELQEQLAHLHSLRRKLEELCIEVYQDLEQPYVTVAKGIAGRPGIAAYLEGILRFAKHIRDVGILARMPHAPGRPSPRELAALELRTSVLGDMIALQAGVPFTRKGVQRAHSLMLDASDPDRSYWLLGSSPRSEEVRFELFSSFVLTVGPPSVIALYRRSGEVYPTEKNAFEVHTPPASGD